MTPTALTVTIDGRLRAFFATTRHGAKPIYGCVGDWRKKFEIDALLLTQKLLSKNLLQSYFNLNFLF